MRKEFQQAVWDDKTARNWFWILDFAIAEDLGTLGDCTTLALVPDEAEGRAAIVARQAGVLAGEAAIAATLPRFGQRLRWSPLAHDAELRASRQEIGILEGPARAMLALERPLLNMLGRLSGIASLTRQYVDAVAGTRAGIYDTRKTTPGWRVLEKYAVRCGGGRNHRAGLFEAVLIKDNHLALGAKLRPNDIGGFSPAEAVLKARQSVIERFGEAGRQMIVEVEVDTLEQLEEVLSVQPDLILLDNMSPSVLREAVARRDARCPAIELEASGGISLGTVRHVAETGVERISVGALTHSAVSLDFGLDWR
jgi:nicotinate-nucleotide pyrophosphorylase (carboxylating)